MNEHNLNLPEVVGARKERLLVPPSATSKKHGQNNLSGSAPISTFSPDELSLIHI